MTDKMIIILEKPIKCNRCPMYEFVNGGVLCRLNFEWIADKEGSIKKCPLKPLPQKIDPEDPNNPWFTEYRLCDGWNECLDEIAGEEK